MTGQLITLPARISARGARLLLHAAEDVTGMAIMGTLRVAGVVSNLRSGPGGAPTSTRPAPRNGTGEAYRTRPGPNGTPSPLASDRLEAEGKAVSVDLDAPPPTAPDHVSQEPVVVREESEPGAEEGAGAEVSVREPWEGYQRMPAREIIARLPVSGAAELAAVALYESTHRKRQTVLTAVQRALAAPGR